MLAPVVDAFVVVAVIGVVVAVGEGLDADPNWHIASDSLVESRLHSPEEA